MSCKCTVYKNIVRITVKQTEVYGFTLEMRQLILMQILLIILNLLSSGLIIWKNSCTPSPNQSNGILKNATIAAPLKHLGNFLRSPEMPLINCKVELKLKWKKYCILTTTSNDNTNANNPNNIIFTIKDTIICSFSNFISKRQPKIIKTS